MRMWFIVSLVVTLVALAASLYLILVVPDKIPERMPTHWNIESKADAWVPREQAWKYLLLMPAFMAFLTALTLVLPWLSPRVFSPERFRGTYYFIMGVVVVFFGYIDAVILAANLEYPIDFGRWFAGGFFLFFAVLGNVLGKVRRNFWVGVRTPWTLASERVWNQTHRFAGWLWVVTGIVGLVAALAGVSLVVCFVGFITSALIPVVYSLILYKHLERTGRLHEEAPEVAGPAT